MFFINRIKGKRESSTKSNILIVADQSLWAYHEIQKFIKRHLSDQFNIFTDFSIFYKSNPTESLRYTLGRWRLGLIAWPFRKTAPISVKYDIIVVLGFYFPYPQKLTQNTRFLIKGIYTDGFPPKGVAPSDRNISIEHFCDKYLEGAHALVCGSHQIVERYQNCFPVVRFANAIDESLFRRVSPKLLSRDDRFVVGWTGNPNREFKGYYDYIIPAVKKAAESRPGIVLKSKFKGSLKTLPRFFDDVDVVLIASVGDAGPSLFQEASLCDVPTVSNRSGWPGEVIDDGINGLLVDREISAMSEALVKLYDDRDLLFSFSNRVREDFLKHLGTEQLVKDWRDLFMYVLTLETKYDSINSKLNS